MKNISFNTDPNKTIEKIKHTVQEVFDKEGLSMEANSVGYIRVLIALTFTYSLYGLILTGWFTELQMLGMCLLMGAGFALIGMGLMHDACHGSFSQKRKWINTFLGQTMNLIGASKLIWEIHHNIIHHSYTNIYRKDVDLEISNLLRFSPEVPYRWIHRFQPIYGFFMYFFLTLGWLVLLDFKHLFKFNGEYGRGTDKKHQLMDIISLFLWKAFYLFYALYIPYILLGLPFWKILIGFTCVHLVLGFLIALGFQPTHILDESEHPHMDENGHIHQTWLEYQLKNTSNYANDNKFVTWFVGGLNYQIEHHLFPKVFSYHYPRIKKIIKPIIEEAGLPYKESVTVRTALYSHWKLLKKLSVPNQPHL